MVRALSILLLTAMLWGAAPTVAAADPLDVSFEVVRETPVSVTIRATISGATAPLDVTARVDGYHDAPAPGVNAVEIQRVSKVAVYRHTPEYETVRIPIGEKIATMEAEVEAMRDAPAPKGEQRQLQEEAINGKEDELSKVRAEADYGATYYEAQEVAAHRYALEYRETREPVAVANVGDKILLTPQSWAESPPDRLVSDKELTLDSTPVNWGEAVSVYEYTLDIGEIRRGDGWGSAGMLVLTINGRDYYDDTNSSWWDAEWSHRMKLTIDNSASTEALTDFPLMVKLTTERFAYWAAQDDGDDIRFVDSDGTALDYECDTWEHEGDSWYWVSVPNIPAGSTDDYIWLYYGEPDVANGENAEGVWPITTWAAVYHMNDNPSGTGILDSTANANHGTKGVGAAAPTEVAGLVGMAQEFSFADGTYIVPAVQIDYAVNATVMVLLKPTVSTATTYQYIVSGGESSGRGSIFAYTQDRYRAQERAADGSTLMTNIAGYVADAWTLLTFTQNAPTSAVLRGISPGVDSSTTSAAFDPQTRCVRIGNYTTTYGWNGPMCELRIASSALSEEWIEADYLSMMDSMLTYGEPIEGPGVPDIVPAPYPIAVSHALLCVAVGLAAVRQKHLILYVAAFLLLLFLALSLDRTAIPLIVFSASVAGFMLYSATLCLFGRR